jgi:F-type H+-transporting ATPase subunit b
MVRAWVIVPLVATVLAAGAANVVLAAEQPAKEPGYATAEKDHGEVKNIFHYALDLTIWTVVVFLVLVFVLARFAWKPMLTVLQQREESIRTALAEAQKARQDAESLRDQFQRQMDSAQEQVRGMLDEARRDAQHARDEMIAGARNEIRTERDRLRREIETARDQALQELWNQTAHLATLVSAKAIGRQLTEDDHRRLVDEALREMRSPAARGNGRDVARV